MRKTASVCIGNAGEHLVMAELLAQGFQAFMADRGNPAFDVAVDAGGITSMIRVKTTTADLGAAQWAEKPNGEIFIDLRRERDFVALVDLRKGVRAAVIYIIPTSIVDNAIRSANSAYMSHPKRGGGERKASERRILRLDGQDRADNPSFGFGKKWQEFR